MTLPPSLAPAPPRRLDPGWPLSVLCLGFPLWWLLGLSQVIFFIAAAGMAVILRRQGRLRTPRHFGVWLLFLGWMLAGVLLLWATAPGTVPGGGWTRVANFGVYSMWYAAITIAMLYVTNTATLVPTLRVVRLLGWMFVVTASFGVAAVFFPSFELTSPMELLLPRSVTSSNFVNSMIHPALAAGSDFLGYEQARPKAPFPYSNAWGNNLALYAPFFFLSWFGKDAGWRRKAAPLVLIAAALPITFSLNRGLWLAAILAAVYATVRLALNGHKRPVLALGSLAVVGALAFVSTPLYDTVVLRLETPHSNDRRASTAETVISTTASGSPIAGYGTTRTMQGSFNSLAGGETADCHQCAAPPLGTQGYLWRLILTTGFVGTALFLSFLGLQFLGRARGPDPVDVATCTVLLIAVVCFFVYDSLGSAMFTVAITVGLMARRAVEPERDPDAEEATQ
ncbi:hypothetical protein [Nocardioides sp. YIM 152588]|uniref:hypothetical protein n=1 Tax=Nocardioides sp. YIM 152588 TaxID=3158259 RepID=UPI0032E46A36